MPFSYTTIVVSGGATAGPFTVPFPYLAEAHVSCTVDNVAATFSFTTASSITLDSAAANGATVRISRTTPVDTPLTDFTDGSVLIEADLDNSTLQVLYAVQETADSLEDALIKATDGHFTAQSLRIEELAEPVVTTDAATKNYVDTANAATNVAAAQAAQAAAETAETGAQAAQTAAQAAQTAAEAAASSVTGSQVPNGGTAGQRLEKVDGTDGNTAWVENIADDEVTFAKLQNATGAGYIGAAAAGAFTERTLAQLRGDVFAPAISTATPVGGDHLFLGDTSDSDTVKRATIDDILALGGGGLSVADSQNLSAVSSYTLSVPSGAERILIVAADLSVSSFTAGILRIGDAGGVETTNYDTYSYGGNYNPGSGFSNRADSTKGANNFWDTGDSPLFYTSGPNGFKIELYNSGGNEWLCDSVFWSDNNSDHVWGKKMGAKTLSAELTSVELSRASGNISGNIRSWVA